MSTVTTATGTYRIVAPDEFSASWGLLREFAGVWEDTHHNFRTKREAVKFVTESL